MRGKAVSTIMRRLAAIAFAHRRLGHAEPTRSRTRQARSSRGIRRTLGTAPKQKAPATVKYVRAMLKAMPDTIIGKRDRALLLMGFGAALRRSELVALDVSDIERQPEGNLGPHRAQQDRPGRRRPVGRDSARQAESHRSARRLARRCGNHIGPRSSGPSTKAAACCRTG